MKNHYRRQVQESRAKFDAELLRTPTPEEIDAQEEAAIAAYCAAQEEAANAAAAGCYSNDPSQ